MPGHISNLPHRSESFLAHCTHCKSSGLYWYCITDRRKFYSEYLLRVLLPPQLAEGLFDHGLSSFFLTVRLLKGEGLQLFAKITSLGLLCTAISANPQFRHPTWRPFRAGMFISLGLSALFPVVHGVRRFGIRQMNKQIGLFWVVLQGSLYILGACIYAVSPEICLTIQSLICKFSDPNTRASISWPLRYLDKLSPNFSHYGGTGYNISPSRIGQCL
jgi:hypothetical protein